MTVLYILAAVFGLLGAILALLVPIIIVNSHKICTAEAEAVVVDVRERCRDGIRTYAPTYDIMFDGKTIRSESILYTSSRLKIGEKVKLRIDPADPSNYYDPSASKMAMVVLRIVGFSFFAVSAVCVLIAVLVR